MAVACVALGLALGIAGTLVAQNVDQRFLNFGLFLVNPGEAASLRVTLDDKEGEPPATVALQFIDEGGTIVAQKRATLQPGQSAILEIEYVGLLRAHAQTFEPKLGLSARRQLVGTVEVLDLTTRTPRPVCSVADPDGVGGRPN